MNHLVRMLLFTAFSLGASSFCFAQQSINAGSHSALIGTNQFSYSIGEMTLVNTERNPSLIVTQGYWQPASSGAAGQQTHSGLDDLAGDLKVYPNPSEQYLFIESTRDLSHVSIKLIDGAGKVVLENPDQSIETGRKQTLDLTALAAGTYFLLIDSHEPKYLNAALHYTIQKIN